MIGGALLAVGTVFLLLYLRPQQKEIAVLLGMAGTLLLFGIAFRNTVPALKMLRDTAAVSSVSSEVNTMIKALGISAVAQITADICRESGEPVLAGQVEFLAKTEILVLALPMAAELLSITKALLS